MVPPTRCTTAEEVANAALFLASDLLGSQGGNVTGIRNHGPFGRKDHNHVRDATRRKV